MEIGNSCTDNMLILSQHLQELTINIGNAGNASNVFLLTHAAESAMLAMQSLAAQLLLTDAAESAMLANAFTGCICSADVCKYCVSQHTPKL